MTVRSANLLVEVKSYPRPVPGDAGDKLANLPTGSLVRLRARLQTNPNRRRTGKSGSRLRDRRALLWTDWTEVCKNTRFDLGAMFS